MSLYISALSVFHTYTKPPLNLHQTSTKIRQMPSFSVIAMKNLDIICDTIHTNTKGVTIKIARFTPETHRFTIKTHGVTIVTHCFTIVTHCFTPETHGFSLKFSREFNPYSWTFVWQSLSETEKSTRESDKRPHESTHFDRKMETKQQKPAIWWRFSGCLVEV